jgi:hypothetical protein
MLYVTIKDFENYKTDQHWFLGGKTNWFGNGFQDLIGSTEELRHVNLRHLRGARDCDGS